MASQIPLLSPRRSHNWRRSIKENDPRAAATKMSSQQNRMFRHLTPVRIGLRSFDRWLIKIEGKNIPRQQRWAQTMCRLLTLVRNVWDHLTTHGFIVINVENFLRQQRYLYRRPPPVLSNFFIWYQNCNAVHTHQIQQKLLSLFDIRGPLTFCQSWIVTWF